MRLWACMMHALDGNAYLELMKLIASNAFSILTIGRIGPKISSCMTGSVGFTLVRMVGSMNLSDASDDPPMATSDDLIRLMRRLEVSIGLLFYLEISGKTHVKAR